MMMSFYLCKHARRDPTLSDLESKSLRYKRNLFVINIVSILLASYFFIRHNDHCEGGSEYFRIGSITLTSVSKHFSLFLSLYSLLITVYTLFAFFEYIVVLTNMAFHVTAIYDFHNQHLVFDWNYGLRIHYQ